VLELAEASTAKKKSKKAEDIRPSMVSGNS